MPPTIFVKNLSKYYGKTKAVDDLTFSVDRGEIFGLLGPNGAGKTTLVGILTTLISPDSGYAEVAGYSIDNKLQVRKKIGVVFQEPALDTKLTGWENLEFHAMLYGIGKNRREKIERVLKIVGLLDKANVLVEKYSGGMKRKLEMARAFIHNPEILFLDEPTLGLDVQTRRKIWDYIVFLRENGVTVFLTTHYIEEAEKLCDRVAIMDRGKIVAIDKVDNLKKILGKDTIYVEVSEYSNITNLISELEKIPDVSGVTYSDGVIQILVKGADTLILKILKKLDEMEAKIKRVSIKTPDLEDVFIHLTGRKFES